MDFISPLPMDNNCDCILSITDRLGADIRIIPTRMDISAEDLAVVFFDNWYCENGLPSNIVCDRDKLFVSQFWKALTKLMGVNLKMSSSYHPETDGASEQSNKTINQMLCYHVRRNQKGWVCALPRIRFQIMNTVNASTNYSGFQLHLGRAPHVIPPIIPDTLENIPLDATQTASQLIQILKDDVANAHNNLLHAKIQQVHHADSSRGPDPNYKVNDFVMLSTTSRWHEYKKKGEKCTAKFFPRWDGPYRVTDVHSEASTYTLDIRTNAFPVYHASELKPHHVNDPLLFPNRQPLQPGSILTTDSLEEYTVDEITDSRRRGRGWQFLVRWLGYEHQHDQWLPASELVMGTDTVTYIYILLFSHIPYLVSLFTIIYFLRL